MDQIVFTIERFIMDYHMINRKFSGKPYPLPRIGETMQQLEEFQYETALDINMGYYIINILPGSQERTAIVTAFFKLR